MMGEKTASKAAPAHGHGAQATPGTPAKASPAPAVHAPAADAATIQELTATLKRLQADFENHIKRSDRERTEIVQHAAAGVLLKVLRVVDEFELALKQLEGAKMDPKLLDGMRMVNKNIHAVLEDEGVRPIDCLGKKLDPFKHEVLRRVKNNGVTEDTILDEHVKGYMLKDKVLRYAKVSVAVHDTESNANAKMTQQAPSEQKTPQQKTQHNHS